MLLSTHLCCTLAYFLHMRIKMLLMLRQPIICVLAVCYDLWRALSQSAAVIEDFKVQQGMLKTHNSPEECVKL